MTGSTVQTLMRMIDGQTRFRLRGDIVSTADEIALMVRIPDVDDAAIYAWYEYPDGRMAVGLAIDDKCMTPVREWVDDQLAHPILRSIDRVDIFGTVIRDLTEGTP
jgi:hypothetical protein